jgi:hypothetical protein
VKQGGIYKTRQKVKLPLKGKNAAWLFMASQNSYLAEVSLPFGFVKPALNVD